MYLFTVFNMVLGDVLQMDIAFENNLHTANIVDAH